MGATEKSWGHVKDLKSGQHLQGVLYSSAAMEKIDAVGFDAMFGDKDIK
jgi:hypothetical protein